MAHAELDIEQEADLVRYLRASARIGPDEEIQFRVLAGGVSNRTVWIGAPPENPGS